MNENKYLESSEEIIANATPTTKSNTSQIIDFLYNRFLLRDMVGKVIPGIIFIILIVCGIFPATQIESFVSRLSQAEGIAVSACAWLIALSLQSIQSRLMHFYFWRRSDQPLTKSFLFKFEDREMLYMATFRDEVRVFFQVATSDEKAQYERYLVIKEACGNSFFCLLSGTIFFAMFQFLFWIPIGILIIYILTALYLMKQDNLYRQMAFAKSIEESYRLKRQQS